MMFKNLNINNRPSDLKKNFIIKQLKFTKKAELYFYLLK